MVVPWMCSLSFVFVFVFIFVWFAHLRRAHISYSGQYTGAIFEDNQFYNDDVQMLRYATDEANDKILDGMGMRLGVEVRKIEYGREYAVSKRVCELLEVRSA